MNTSAIIIGAPPRSPPLAPVVYLGGALTELTMLRRATLNWTLRVAAAAAALTVLGPRDLPGRDSGGPPVSPTVAAPATADELVERLNNAWFARWIYDTGLPTLHWSTRTGKTSGGHETTVNVRPQGLPGPLPLEISIRTGEGWDTRRVVLDPAGGSWTWESPGPVRDVRINENRGILAETKKVRRLPTQPQR